MDLKTSMLLWMVLIASILLLIYGDRKHIKRYSVSLAALAVIRSLVTLGMQPTLFLLGFLQVYSYLSGPSLKYFNKGKSKFEVLPIQDYDSFCIMWTVYW